MSTKNLTLTIVIPVYNEEHHIKGCLDAIARQTTMPDEVIVVDNNCTDKTIAIARKYPFVRVIKEKTQGHAAPRNSGFDAVKHDIIGRIDADSRIAPTWVARVKADFADTTLAGVTGIGKTDMLPRVRRFQVQSTFWCRIYYLGMHAFYHTITTWGANMAIRRSSWQQVRAQVRANDDITHEDHDVSLLIAGLGGKIIQDNELCIYTAGQTYNYLPRLLNYARLNTLTKRHHIALGTFTNPKFTPLPVFSTLPGCIVSLLAGALFTAISVLLWPIDWIMLAWLHHTDWLAR